MRLSPTQIDKKLALVRDILLSNQIVSLQDNQNPWRWH